MRKKIIILLALILLGSSCRKEETDTAVVPQLKGETLSMEQVRDWLETDVPDTGQQSLASTEKMFRLSTSLLDPSKLEVMPNVSGNYLLQQLSGQPKFQGRLQGYRKIAFIRDMQGRIQARILEIIPDGLYLQRKHKVSTADFTGRIFLYDSSYQLLGGTVVADGKKIGEIKAAQPGENAKTNTIQLAPIPITQTCVWQQSNYVDAEGVVVVYAENICTYNTSGNGFGDISGGYDAGGGNYIPPGGGGGGSLPGSSPTEVSNLPGESGGAVNPKAYISCFAGVPDAGATMKITVYVQEPQPGTSFNIGKNSVGHVAIGLSKVNGNQSVNQVLGFYPNATGLDKMHAPSKVVDNGGTLDFNVSISYSISAEQFKQIADYVSNAPSEYDLVSFNCTNFVYNACSAGGIQLPNPMNNIGIGGPGGQMDAMTPAGLGSSIENLKGQNNVNTSGGTSPFSKGPCN